MVSTLVFVCLCVYIHDVIRDVDRKKERQKERKTERKKTPEAMEKRKMRVASGGIRTHVHEY